MEESEPRELQGSTDDSEPSSIQGLDVTELLQAWGDGESDAFEKLLPMVYRELRSMADRSLRKERGGHTLQATALVNEAYLRLIQQDRVQWRNRNQFMGIAAQLMRRILVDHARKRQAAKRDAGIRMTLEDGEVEERGSGSATREVNLISLDGALVRLSAMDPRQARIVELRYFCRSESRGNRRSYGALTPHRPSGSGRWPRLG